MKKYRLLIASILVLFFTSSCLDSPKEDDILIIDPPGFHKTTALPDDMKFTEAQKALLEKHGTLFLVKPDYVGPNIEDNPLTNLPRKKAVTYSAGVLPIPYNLWAMVRFTYGDNLSAFHKEKIKEALKHWEEKTNVRFYNATGKPISDPTYGFDYPYVEFVQHPNKNDSYVGRIGGRQVINIHNFSKDVIVHEIGHAIGLFHEHNHPNRDNYINVNFDNIKKGHHNWKKIKSNYYTIGGVDFKSVMLYDSYLYNSEYVYDIYTPIMTKKDGATFSGGVELSDMDSRWANTFYLPYIARSDTYAELDKTVYKPNGTIMTEQERIQLQASLNNGNPNPPANGRIPNDF